MAKICFPIGLGAGFQKFIALVVNWMGLGTAEEFNGLSVEGRALQVNEARPQEGGGGRRPGGGGRGFSGGRGGRGGRGSY